jgi:5'-3' exonuclease
LSKLVIIDGDGLCYHASKDSLEESLLSLNERIQNIFNKTEATHYIVFISNTPYFRHNIDKNYKSFRSKQISPLKWLKTLKSYLKENWYAQSMDLVESDDLCAYWYNQDICIDDSDTHFAPRYMFESALEMCKSDNMPEFTFKSVEKVLCSPDKDLLQSIEGKHFNYSYKLTDKNNVNSVIKGWWIETSLEDSVVNFWKSMTCGDASDGIKGIEGRGIKYFEKVFKDRPQPVNYDLITLDMYQENYGKTKGIYEFQKNYRLLHLLNCNEDFMREIDEIPTIPIIKEVVRDLQIENNNEINAEF